MDFVYIDKNEFEADTIANILNSENINFKTKVRSNYIPLIMGILELKYFDIKFNTDYQKYLFVDKLIQDKLNNYKKLEKCFSLPDYQKDDIKNILDKKVLEIFEAMVKEEINKKISKPKETLLLKLIKWLKK